eukprot:gene65288-89316_t
MAQAMKPRSQVIQFSVYVLMPQAMKPRAQVIQWLMFQMGGVGPMQGQANVFFRYFPEKIPSVIERYQKETKRLFTVLDTRLKDHEYLVDDFSIADIAHWSWVHLHDWPGNRPGVAPRVVPIRFCSRWGLPCRPRCRVRGGLLPHLFTLAAGAPEAVALAGRYPAPYFHGARTFLPRLSRKRPPSRLTGRSSAISSTRSIEIGMRRRRP